MNKKIVIVSVHPDDETLGCGGTILKHKSMHDEVYCIYITNGNVKQSKLIPLINSMYRFEKSYCLNIKELKIADLSLNDLIPKLAEIISEIQPNELYIPNRSDAHSDHRFVFLAIIPFLKTFRYPSIKRILMYEVISETEFAPSLPENIFLVNVYIDITNFIEQKLEIMKLYSDELMPDNQPRSISAIKGLSIYRGSRIGVFAAEAFMLIFEKI